jgi:transposase
MWAPLEAPTVSAQPDATLDELRAWMLASHGVSVSQGGMWNALDRLGLTLKKRRNTPPSRSGRMLPRPAPLGARFNRA